MKDRQFQIILVILILFIGFESYSQNRIDTIDKSLNNLSTTIPGLNQTIDFTASNATIQELVRAIGVSNKINLSIDPEINLKVINNFSGVKAKDILLFLCNKYDLDITIIGSIISIHKYTPPVETIKYTPKSILIDYNKKDSTLSLDLNNDSLFSVTKKITDLSGKNFILGPEIKNQLVSTYIKEMPFKASIEQFTFANGLSCKLTDDGFYLLSKSIQQTNNVISNPKSNIGNQDNSNKKLIVNYYNNLFSIEAVNANISEIINELSSKSGQGFYLLSPVDKQISMVIQNVSFEEFLLFVLMGTEYSFAVNTNVFVIGKRDEKGLKYTKAIQLQFRSVLDIIKYIPSSIKSDLEIIEFKEQNSLIVSGNQEGISKLEKLILEIDKIVPMVVIDVLIIDNKSNYTISTGVEAGISKEPVANSVSVLPELDVTLGAESINKLINSFNGYGLVNLGKVTPNFYISLKAMESNGDIKVNSTPKLSTLNGSEATLTLGNTTYYYEERNDVIATQSTQNIKTKQYKPLKADFKITIKPIVSGDDQITLEISVDQSDFTGEVVDGAPPGQVTRSFSSIVRVKNEEMVLLGGLEEKTKTEETTGWPFLSRIPVLKWFFSSRTKSNKVSKLNIFIKPTIIY